MAMKPQLPKQAAKKNRGRATARDLKAKRDPKGGAQKKEIGDGGIMVDRVPSGDRVQ